MQSEDEGMSTGKKVVTGAALGVAIPAVVVGAKKLLSDDEESREKPRKQSTRSGTGQSSGATRKGTTSARKSTPSRASGAKRSSAKTSTSRTTAESRTTGKKSATAKTSRSTKSGGSSARKTSRTGTRSSGSSGTTRTRDQLYRQATRLKIEGRSSMTKAQLERAIARARSRT